MAHQVIISYGWSLIYFRKCIGKPSLNKGVYKTNDDRPETKRAFYVQVESYLNLRGGLKRCLLQ